METPDWNRDLTRFFRARFIPAAESPVLDASEVEPFLEFLFSDVAERPRPLTLREGAAVARYLKGLAHELRRRPGAKELDRMADVIWLSVFIFASFKASNKRDAIRFLKKHRRTYLLSFDVPAAIEAIQQSPEPQAQSGCAPAPLLMSKGLSVGGHGEPRLQNDLSERICAAYHLLRRSRVRNARGRIAKALNELGMSRRSQSQTAPAWDSYEVADRVKQHERQGKKKACPEPREKLIDRWLSSFRRTVASKRQPDQSPG